MKIVERSFAPRTALSLMKEGASPVIARALAARGVTTVAAANGSLEGLLPYTALKGAEQMASIMADAIEAGKQFLVVADYDADGATACVVAVSALKAFGANVSYLIPDRIEHGYGLSPAIVDIAAMQSPRPDYLVTVDNGIAAYAGIERSNELGIPVLVTDHHLPGDKDPAALCVVNPNQRGCEFPSKALAGCGAIYYVMWALQDELVFRGWDKIEPDFEVSSLLPIVAIGTVADVVPLDSNNRALVSEGLARIRAGACSMGVKALAAVSGKSIEKLCASDIAFGLGPRINAAGRLESMTEGVECLLSMDESRAVLLARSLHEINDRRKEMESDMVEEAVRRLICDVQEDRRTVVLHSDEWHPGVIGIVAGRIKEMVWRPTFILTSEEDGSLKGSGRSIPGFHLRDALDLVDRRNPGILLKFGGHAMAAGLTLAPGALAAFQKEFEKVACEFLEATALQQVLEVDGDLEKSEFSLETVSAIRGQVWGQTFPEPLFYGEFNVIENKLIGNGKHLRLVMEKNGVRVVGVKFRQSENIRNGKVMLAYKLDENVFRGESSLQVLVEHIGEQ